MIPELAAGKQRKYRGPIMLTEVSIAVLDRGFCDIQATDSLLDMFIPSKQRGRLRTQILREHVLLFLFLSSYDV